MSDQCEDCHHPWADHRFEDGCGIGCNYGCGRTPPEKAWKP